MTSDGRGSGAGIIIAVVLLIVVLAGLFLLNQNSAFGQAAPTDVEADININPPATTNQSILHETGRCRV